jgi:hypothetical protein
VAKRHVRAKHIDRSAASFTAPRMVYTTAARNQNEAVLRGAVPDAHSLRYDRLVESRMPPSRIDTSRPYSDTGGAKSKDYLGGLDWCKEADAYFKHSLPAAIAEARRLWIEWWRIPYVLGRAAVAVGKEKLDAVLALERDGVHPRTLERRSRHTLTWIARAKAQVMRCVRALLPHDLYDHPYRLAQSLAD